MLDALRAILTGSAEAPWRSVPDLGELGEALAPLLPVAAEFLTGTAPRVHPRRDIQILAARTVAAAAGPERVLPTVEAVLVAGDTPARHDIIWADELLQEMIEDTIARLRRS